MRVYYEIARVSFQRQFSYRGAALAGMVANGVFGVIIASVYSGFFGSRPDSGPVEGFELSEMLAYIWIGQALIAVLPTWGWYEIAKSVQSGEIVTDLMKPIDYYAMWLWRHLGRGASQVFLRGIPTLVLGSLLFDLALPASASRWLAFAITTLLAILVSYAIHFLVNISAVWFTDVGGIALMTTVGVNFFSGFLVPITFFPDWLETVANLLPFRAMVMAPATVALGQSSFWPTVALQAFWIIVMTFFARWVLARATRRLEIYGG